MPFIQLQFRRGTASQWTSANPILADGELAIESDTSQFKIGNGNTSWTLLPYGGLAGPAGVIGSVVPIDISFNANIFVGRDVSFGGKLTVRNDVSFNTELRVGGNVNVRSGISSTSTTTGALIVAGGVGVGGNMWSAGNLNVALDASLNSRLLVGGNVLIGGNLIVGLDSSFNGNVTFSNLPYFNGNASAPASNQLVTKSYVDVNGGTILLSGNNTWTANNTFNGSRFYVGADASFNGNLTVREDVSFNKRLFVGGDASFNGNLTVREDVSFNKRLFVGGDASFNGNLIVRGDVSFNDNMSVQSDSSFNNRLYVGRQIGVGVTANASYALDVFGNINMTGNLFLNNKLFSITSADISLNANLMVGADASFNGNVFLSKTLNLKKTVITGAAIGSPTSIVATTPIVELTGVGASTAYFTLANGFYAGQTLTINSATNGGGNGLFVNATASNIIFNGSVCSQMRFSNAFQTVNLIWSADATDWIVASWQGVNFSGVSMNFGTYTSGDITLGAAGRVNISAGGNLVVGSDSSFNGNLSVGGFLNVNGYVNADSYTEKFVNVVSSSGTYTADFIGGLILYVNAFSGTSTPTLSITNLPTILNQSYVFTVVYSGAPTSTYFSALNINGVSVPVNGTVSLTSATSYYIHQFCIFVTDASNLGNNLVVQNFNSSSPLSLVSPTINGNLSLNGNLYVGSDILFNGKLYGNSDISLIGNVRIRNATTSSSTSTGALVVTGGIGVTGNVYISGNGHATSFNNTSDYRIKQNVRLLCEDASFNVDVLRPVTYDNLRLGKTDIGFIAHEVGEYYPYLVNGEKDGEEMQSLNYIGIIGILTKEIQELKKRVSDLEWRLP